jgi:hypothetical protein
VLLDDRLADGQSEAGAGLRAGVAGVDLVEALEDLLLLVRSDAAVAVASRRRRPRCRYAVIPDT